MQRLRQWIRVWLGFSRTETNGFLILLPVMILLIISAPLYSWWAASKTADFSSEYAHLDSIARSWELATSATPKDSVKNFEAIATLTRFDPNKASVDDLKALGFTEFLSKRIVNYRQKGGVFRVKRDLMKIYGVDSTFYHQLFAYIDLPEYVSKQIPAKNTASETAPARERRKIWEKLDLNVADTGQLKNVNGIGRVLAGRIVKFREALGGFISMGQVREIYGLDSLLITRINEKFYVEENFRPARININTSDQKALEGHPYISRSLAKSIISYRFQHGGFRDVGEIKSLFTITAPDAEKLLPYLTVTD